MSDDPAATGYHWTYCVQGSADWRQARLGKATASKFADIMSKGMAGQLSKTAQTYLLDLIAEQMTGQPRDEIQAKALAWGNKHEANARASFSMATGISIDQVGFASLVDMPEVGCSSDGLIGDDGNLEIKCPFNPTNHLKTLAHHRVPSEYKWQIQGQLWILKRSFTKFVSYDPRMEDDRYKRVIIHVNRDEKMIDELREKVAEFVAEMKAWRCKIEAQMEKYK